MKIMIDTIEIHTKNNICTTLYGQNKFFDLILVEKRAKMASEHILRNISKSRQTLDLKLGMP